MLKTFVPLLALAALAGCAGAPTTPTAVSRAGNCPQATLIANAWSLSAMPSDMREKAKGYITVAENRDSKNASDPDAYRGDDVSRTLGRELRERVKNRAIVSTLIPVQFRDPRTLKVTDTALIRMVAGIGSIPVSDEQRTKIIETIWPLEFLSPTVSGGAPRLWILPDEWKSLCTLNVHGVKS